jgi:hypothetical protein
VLLVPAAFDEHFVIDTQVRAVMVSESFLGRVAQVTRWIAPGKQTAGQ